MAPKSAGNAYGLTITYRLNNDEGGITGAVTIVAA
jgi:hypothetical protein